MKSKLVRLEPCTARCRGQSCCDCCGKAPCLHLAGTEYFPFQRYDKDCCPRTLVKKPEKCMCLQGKTREAWMKENM